MNKKKKRTGPSFFVKILIFLLLFFSAYFLLKTVKEVNFSELSVRTENAVNRGLVESNLTSSQLVKQYQEEKESPSGRWVQFFKTFSVKSSDYQVIFNNIKKFAGDIKPGIEIKTVKTGKSAEIILSYKRNILNKIILLYKESGPRVAIIVDDMGYKKDIGAFLELDVPLTFAIMPDLPYSSFLAEEFKRSSINYILHMPMEPEGYPETNPGSNALFTGMSRNEMLSALEKAMGSVKGAEGLNNHMGSRFTADAGSMNKLMSILAEKGLFFMDSYTSGKSLGLSMAEKYGVPSVKNDVFLDNKDEYGYIAGRMELLKKTALENEKTAAICHGTRKHITAVLKEYIPQLKKEGIRFVTVQELLD